MKAPRCLNPEGETFFILPAAKIKGIAGGLSQACLSFYNLSNIY
jgi:tRNA1(Val) A37 N6-methylase TrmN6